jgi:hypothetical protein
MFGCQSREVGPLTAAVVAQLSSSPAAQNDGVISPVPETLCPRNSVLSETSAIPPYLPYRSCLYLRSRFGWLHCPHFISLQ